MNKGYISTKNITKNIFEKKSSIFNTEKYILWKLSVNWEKIFNKVISEKCEPKFLYNGTLHINVNDASIYQVLITSQLVIIEKVNEFLERNLVYNLEIKKINRNLDREKIKEKIEDESQKIELKNEKNFNQEEQKYENIEVSKEKIKQINESIEKIDRKYSEIAEKIRKIAINMAKKEIYLLNEGYKKCEKCKEVFLPNKNEKICFNCYEKEEVKKQGKMRKLIEENPYIRESDAIILTKTDAYTYYRIRDVLAQRTYNDLLYLCEKINIEIEENSDYKEEIRKESKIDVEILIKKYIDYKIGTNDINVYKKERNKVLKKIKMEMQFRKNK